MVDPTQFRQRLERMTPAEIKDEIAQGHFNPEKKRIAENYLEEMEKKESEKLKEIEKKEAAKAE